MKKRLRKKKKIREFRVFGAPIQIKMKSEADFDSFLDEFLSEAIEANGCYIGGGGQKDRFAGFIELGRMSDLPETRLKRISEWLDARSEVENYKIGNITDAWYGPFEQLNSTGVKS